MKSGLNFLVAAKRCEIAELRQLALTSALVNLTRQLVHGLQRERGLSNLYLGSQGQHFAAARANQVAECQQQEAALRACFDQLDTDDQPEALRLGHGARLYSAIAYVLHGLDALPGLRQRIDTLAWPARLATEAYVKLITGLLAVVFEAADSAPQPAVSRLLVALFNFMQGKEFAGQERAAGSALFATGHADAAEQQRLLHLIDSQERCLQVFAEFASTDVRALWRDSQTGAALAELERLRRVLCTTRGGGPLDAGLSRPWFDHASERIDGMKLIEDRLAQELLQLCEHQIAQASQDLAAYRALDAQALRPADAMGFFQTPDTRLPPAPGLGRPSQGYGLQVERSILELVQEQAQRLQAISDELETVRASLNERKLIERAKGLLMAHRQLSETEAHKTMRQMAMNQNRRLIDVAKAVLTMAEVLPDWR